MEPTNTTNQPPQVELELDKQLRLAAKQGDHAKVQELLEAGADPNWQGCAAAIYAATNLDWPLFEKLIDAAWEKPSPKRAKALKGADPSKLLFEKKQRTHDVLCHALSLAAKTHNVGQLKQLIDRIKPLPGSLNGPALYHCISSGRVAETACLIDAGFSLFTQRGSNTAPVLSLKRLPLTDAQGLVAIELEKYLGSLAVEPVTHIATGIYLLESLAQMDLLHFAPPEKYLAYYDRITGHYAKIPERTKQKDKVVTRRNAWLKTLAQAKIQTAIARTKPASPHVLAR